ncbi:MAG TPA: ferric reductase-like transmembrane domain-containing protein [Acidimicrobiia bacterium]|jgi:DMSO/TMAO reductase YedYZ heme-binding membrane subunit
MHETLWFLTRASGVVAMVLIIAAIADGLIFSGRAAGKKHLRPAWWLDLHRGLGGYALIFTGLHVLTAFGSDIGVGLEQIFVPGAASSDTTAFTLGVVAMYGMLIAVFTTWPKRLLPRKMWHIVHLVAVPVAILTGLHAYLLGTDAHASWYTVLTLVLVAVVMYPVGLRLSGIYRRRIGATAQRDERDLAPSLSLQPVPFNSAGAEREAASPVCSGGTS